MDLFERIDQIRIDLKSGRFINEAAICQGIILPILNALGWPVFDTHIIMPEYSVEGRRVDYALCHPADRPIIFIEAKKVGFTEGADRQLFEYAFHTGVPLAVLTDGQEWSFYLPGEQGQYHERRVYKLDILERETEAITDRFQRYISYNRVCAGEALKAARADYENVARGREIAATIPKAWKKLLEEPDGLLLDLLAEKVEDLCGYKPALDLCAGFIDSTVSSITEHPQIIKKQNEYIKKIPATHYQKQFKISSRGFMLKGQYYQARSARDVMTQIFELLSRDDSSFLERFASRKHGKKRRYLARNKFELYPGREDLAENASYQTASGWWIGTNYSKRDIQKIIELACEIAGLNYGTDLTIQLD